MGGIGRFSDEIRKRLAGDILDIKKSRAFSPFSSLIMSFTSNDSSRLFFLPGYIPPLFSRSQFVFTIHDLNHLDRPENSSFLKKVFYRFVIKRGCFTAKRIITVSEFSRDRIISWSAVPEDKIINVGNGVDDSFNMKVKPLTLEYPYLLCVSNRKLHKNEPSLIQAFAKANIDPAIKLLFTGNPTTELITLINELNLSERVIFHGFVDDSDLPSLYRGALGLLFPSLYEGFGLPVLEAMACGIPVLTSNVTSLPEVAGDAALLVDPYSVDDIAHKINQLVIDKDLRTMLIERGIARAKMFTWDKVAERVQNILEQVANEKVK
ncbi:glycosyltransferase family 4 protein [Xenorhabdus bovienii]|nr:glycosyltransferase family 4 protein [Xenorhabdus bovienii]MDE9469868.1 glycosyltransferase family 4 protein [Xenorhabdus bovienii]MDE9534056.1 glycosyltransferase family 4 protein [Xenorhabdus bovienii]MDE9586985.1 glycosyltransferase family 4 protein [Xenorhabdus bovienii]